MCDSIVGSPVQDADFLGKCDSSIYSKRNVKVTTGVELV